MMKFQHKVKETTFQEMSQQETLMMKVLEKIQWTKIMRKLKNRLKLRNNARTKNDQTLMKQYQMKVILHILKKLIKKKKNKTKKKSAKRRVQDANT